MFSVTPILISTVTMLTNCIDVTRAVFARETNAQFRVTGTVHLCENRGDYSLLVADASGGAQLFGLHWLPNWRSIREGDTLCVSGVIARSEHDFVGARCRNFNIIRRDNPPPPTEASVKQLASGSLDCHNVRLTGRLVEVFRDEIDLRYVYASIDVENTAVYLTIRADEDVEKQLRAQRGAMVEVTGVVTPGSANARRTLVRTISCVNPQSIRTIVKAPSDPFSVPPAEGIYAQSAEPLYPRERRRLAGIITAVFGKRRLLIRTTSGQTHTVRLAADPIPRCGEIIEAVGLIETDLYRINLSDADWRPSQEIGIPPTHETPAKKTIAYLLTDGHGRSQINPWNHGKLISVEGTVIDVPTAESDKRIVYIKDAGIQLPIDITSAPDILAKISVGCRVEIVGICIVETEGWRPFAAFPHTSGILLAPRTAKDITVIARPPWWTPRRMLIALIASLTTLFLILIWNRALQAAIRRKSRQLIKEQTAKIASEMRTVERTALAVELHDTLSQNLSGVACQIAATKSTVNSNPTSTKAHLETAERMLQSCRTELRRCLMDLRSDALEEQDFTSAIRKVLAPIMTGITANISFNVPRMHVSDTSAHAILCIIRELASNAIRHGNAHTIWITGKYNDQQLSFSVRDDGSGFDIQRHPGPSEGHFGLEGVRERIKRLDGTLTIKSVPGAGTCVAATMYLPPMLGKES